MNLAEKKLHLLSVRNPSVLQDAEKPLYKRCAGRPDALFEITPLTFAGNRAEAIQGRIFSPVTPEKPAATFFDMWFSRVDAKGTIFRGTQRLSKHVRSGYWQMPNVRIIDTVGRERYESSLLYGWKCYINNPLQDLENPEVRRGSSQISVKDSVVAGRPVKLVTYSWDTIENTELLEYYATLVPEKANAIYSWGKTKVSSGRTEVNFTVKDFIPSGRYTINMIMLKDVGLNNSYTYFNPQIPHSDGATLSLDEPAPSVQIISTNPDTRPPELDVNRIKVTAVPTNKEKPDGETVVTLTFTARDDISGLGDRTSFKLRDPQGGEKFYWLVHRNYHTDYFDGDPTAWETYTYQVILPRGSVPGIWGLLQMDLTDKAGNTKGYNFLETVRFDPNSTAAADLNIVGDPVGQSYRTGETIRLSVQTTGAGNVSYEWFKDGVSLAAAAGRAGVEGARTAQLAVSGARDLDAGTYYCVVSNSAGRVVSKAVEVRYLSADARARIGNVSVRTLLQAGQPLIVGLTMDGGAKPVLLRAVGPGLVPFGVGNAMPDPELALFAGAAVEARNDNWTADTAMVGAAAAVGAFPLSSGSKDAVLLRSIANGRTLQVQGAVAGSVLVEAYDAGEGDLPRLKNVSARNRAGPGDEALIAGFSILGNTSKRVLIRAVGPTLGAFGVAGAMADPKLEVYAGSSRIAENDNWAAGLSSAFTAVGAFALPAGSRDAALELTLEPGGYTVHVKPAAGGAGEALIEIYELP